MKIALAQIDCRLGNIPANIETHRAALAEVKERGGADLVLFPELSLTGYRLRSDIHRAMLDDAQLQRVCHKLQLDELLPAPGYCVLGYVELSERAVIHNTNVLLQTGCPMPPFRHRKVYLPNYGMFEEQRYTRPGDRFRSTEIVTAGGERWRVGMLCCEDAWHNSAWLIMQAQGVDLVLVNSASPGRGVEAERLGSQQSWYGILATQAEFTGCWVAYCNRVGFEDDIHFWGGSAIFSPYGEIIAEAPVLEPHLLIGDVSRRTLITSRTMTPLGADENWDLTMRELQGAVESQRHRDTEMLGGQGDAS